MYRNCLSSFLRMSRQLLESASSCSIKWIPPPFLAEVDVLTSSLVAEFWQGGVSRLTNRHFLRFEDCLLSDYRSLRSRNGRYSLFFLSYTLVQVLEWPLLLMDEVSNYHLLSFGPLAC